MLHQSANFFFPSLQRKVIIITPHNLITSISGFLLSGPSKSRNIIGRPFWLRPLIWQGAEELTDRQTVGSVIVLYLLQVLLLHGHQVAPGDVMLLSTV